MGAPSFRLSSGERVGDHNSLPALVILSEAERSAVAFQAVDGRTNMGAPSLARLCLCAKGGKAQSLMKRPLILTAKSGLSSRGKSKDLQLFLHLSSGIARNSHDEQYEVLMRSSTKFSSGAARSVRARLQSCQIAAKSLGFSPCGKASFTPNQIRASTSKPNGSLRWADFQTLKPVRLRPTTIPSTGQMEPWRSTPASECAEAEPGTAPA